MTFAQTLKLRGQSILHGRMAGLYWSIRYRLLEAKQRELQVKNAALLEAAWLALEQLVYWEEIDNQDEGTIEAIAALRAAIDKKVRISDLGQVQS